ncbi:hypothetical protein NDU88_004671 [Pleurodeles waltl]|uniref:Uncharacterized protein n=1 Tax=Pleurodeles waltl TaxID=8319 RepID=A0AAV7TS65_PLEWA|nr:hypothetical protein NDU88_004671 [Pleurodeles waltl]
MVCHYTKPMVPHPGPESQSLSAKKMSSPPYGGGIRYHCGHQSWLRERLLLRKVAFHSPPSEIRCSVSGDPHRFPEISSVLKPLLAEAPLKSPHMPVCMCDQQNARSEQTEQTKDLEDRNYCSFLKHWNQRLNVPYPLWRRKGSIQCCVQYCPYEQETLRGL